MMPQAHPGRRLLVECDLDNEPRALVEYRQKFSAPASMRRPIQVVARLADQASLPAFVVRYGDDFSWFRVRALNRQARSEFVAQATTMTEAEYVEFLHRLRGRRAPCSGDHAAEVFRRSSNSVPKASQETRERVAGPPRIVPTETERTYES